MNGFAYGEMEPKERCPYCRTLCIADFVDIGIGYQQCGPYWCAKCGASEMSSVHADFERQGDGRELTEDEKRTGWYRPNSPPDALANTDDAGNIIRHFEADTLYREKLGVEPRYDMHGRLKPS